MRPSLARRSRISLTPAAFASIRRELLGRPPRTYSDELSPRTADLLARSLDGFLPAEARAPGGGGGRLPPGHHLVYLAPRPDTASLLPDGTDADHAPGPPFARRVWAGGSVDLRGGAAPGLPAADADADGRRRTWAVCTEEVGDVRLSPSAAAAGDKVLVDLVRRYRWARGVGPEDLERSPSAGVHWLEERRTLCFMGPKTAEEAARDAGGSSARTVRAPRATPSYSFKLTPTPALLFRFSALTFNAHAIHLDRQHCREVEGYRDLLVHGPLLLSLIFAALRGAMSGSPQVEMAVARLDYRNLAPVYVGEELKVCVRKHSVSVWDVWVAGPTGGLCVKGTATLAEKPEPC